MGIFSRTLDILSANMSELLDRADDPSKTIRIMILEMEETLVEVRASAARTIADQKELQRHLSRLDALQADWTDKASLALSRDREDLAKAALMERNKAATMATQLSGELGVLQSALAAADEDIAKLEAKIAEARGRQSSISARLESAENRYKMRTMYRGDKVKDAFARFDDMERRVDEAEGRADAMTLGDRPGLGDEIGALADDVDAELARMKASLKQAKD